jgi:hypothetical protein
VLVGSLVCWLQVCVHIEWVFAAAVRELMNVAIEIGILESVVAVAQSLCTLPFATCII